MKPDQPKLSKLEISVMMPFWNKKELTIRQAAEELSKKKNDPGYSTVQTIAGRLEKKGALLRTSKIGKAWLFRAGVEKKTVIGRMMDDLLSIIDGSTSPILSHLVESKKVGETELEEIRKMIKANQSEKEEAQ